MEVGGVRLPNAIHSCLRMGFELDQIARDEPRRDAKVPETLHEQPRGVAARARALLKSLLAGLDTRIKASHIGNCVAHRAIHLQKEADGSAGLISERIKKLL